MEKCDILAGNERVHSINPRTCKIWKTKDRGKKTEYALVLILQEKRLNKLGVGDDNETYTLQTQVFQKLVPSLKSWAGSSHRMMGTVKNCCMLGCLQLIDWYWHSSSMFLQLLIWKIHWFLSVPSPESKISPIIKIRHNHIHYIYGSSRLRHLTCWRHCQSPQSPSNKELITLFGNGKLSWRALLLG